MSGQYSHKTYGTGLACTLLTLAIAWAALIAWQRTAILAYSTSGAGDAARPVWPDMRIDINSASVAELSLLPGLGPGLAQRIVDDREAHGVFASSDDLDRVPGIGRSILERAKPYIVCEKSGVESGVVESGVVESGITAQDEFE